MKKDGWGKTKERTQAASGPTAGAAGSPDGQRGDFTADRCVWGKGEYEMPQAHRGGVAVPTTNTWTVFDCLFALS